MNTLMPEEKKSTWPQTLVVAAVVGLVVGVTVWWRMRPSTLSPSSSTVTQQEVPAASPPSVPGATDPAVAAAAAAAPSPSTAIPLPSTPAPAPTIPPAADDRVAKAGYKLASVVLDGPLESAMVRAVGKELGEPLAQVVARELVWWVDVARGLRKGDTLDVLYQERPDEEPWVQALRFHSSKDEKRYQAYRFKATSDPFARFYEPSGRELEERLEDGPLDQYEQVTSLLRDGRRHKGIDFKTPVGSAVKAPFDAVVIRRNWAFRANGNCLELEERGGARRRATLLHLSSVKAHLTPGVAVNKGEVVASSGNTGRSFAPHLHYQLNDTTGRVIDPFRSHRTYRRSVPTPDKPALEAEVARLTALFPTVDTSQNLDPLGGGR